MDDLQINFAGVEFINPFTVAASPSSDSREKAERALGWKRRVGFDELVSIMVEADLAAYGMTCEKYRNKTA